MITSKQEAVSFITFNEYTPKTPWHAFILITVKETVWETKIITFPLRDRSKY